MAGHSLPSPPMSEVGAIAATGSVDDVRVKFRLPRSAYLSVLFLTFGVTAVMASPWLAFLYLVPIGTAAFIARRGTDVDRDGMTVHAVFRSESLPWESVSGLQIDHKGRAYAAVGRPVVAFVRLPYVGLTGLPVLAEASGGRLPTLPPATLKSAPERRRR